MQNLRIAKKYARAFFNSFDASRYGVAADLLDSIANTWQSDSTIADFFKNPAIKTEDKQATLLSMVGEDHPKTRSLLLILLDNKRLESLPAISYCFQTLYAEHLKMSSLEVTTARELDAAEKESMIKSLKKDFGNELKIDWKIDPELIAGFTVKSGDKLLDSSVGGAVEKFKQSLLA